MSRIGKHPVPVPDGTTVDLSGRRVTAKGKLGELSLNLIEDVEAVIEDKQIVVRPADSSKRARAMWGLQRSLLSNLIAGVSEGFSVGLEIVGVGYRAAVQGDKLNLQLGHSHDINYPIPQGISIKCERPTHIAVSGADKQKVGQVAAEIRGFRKPEPYKGKGIRYESEYVFRKEGKKK